MEKTQFANSLIIGCAVNEQPFFLSEIRQEEHFKLQGKEFSGYILTLQDKSGTIEAFLSKDKVKEEYASYLDAVIKVSGIVLRTENLFIKLDSLSRCEPGEYESKYFVLGLDATKRKTFSCLLKREIAEIKHEGYKVLLKAVFTDETIEKMARYPASLKQFANYHGGLLVSTASLWHICNNIARSYAICANGIYSDTAINTDLLLSAALLHGVGRLREYTEFPYRRSDEAKLQGTVATLQSYLYDVCKEKDIALSKEDEQALISTIISAIDPRGQVKAVTKEAIILQQALILFKLCDERDKIVYDYTGDENVFYAWQIGAYVKNTKNKEVG